jgi:hypothetical protein
MTNFDNDLLLVGFWLIAAIGVALLFWGFRKEENHDYD